MQSLVCFSHVFILQVSSVDMAFSHLVPQFACAATMGRPTP